MAILEQYTVEARYLEPGDTIIDDEGGRHKLSAVYERRDGTIRTKREDQMSYEYWFPWQRFTILRPQGKAER